MTRARNWFLIAAIAVVGLGCGSNGGSPAGTGGSGGIAGTTGGAGSGGGTSGGAGGQAGASGGAGGGGAGGHAGAAGGSAGGGGGAGQAGAGGVAGAGAGGHAGGGGAGGAGTVCGGIAGLTCGLGEFCQFNNGECGAGDQQGLCTLAGGAVCPVQPVCGCDGKTYSTACAAHDNGVDTMGTASCIPGNGGTGAPCGQDTDCMSGYKCCVTGGAAGSPIACRDVGAGSCPALP